MIKRTKILLLYQYDSHQFIIDCLIENINTEKFEVDYFNTKTLRYSRKNSYLLKILQSLVRIPKLRVIVYFLFRNKLIKNISDNYEIIDIHYLSKIYDGILPKFKGKVKITFWGSDIYRVNEERRKNFPILLKNVSVVHVTTPLMESYFNKYNKFHLPIVTLPMGLKNFDLIKETINKLTKSEIKKQLKLADNKYIITLGYNANPSQQHLKILDQLTQLKREFKEKCYFIVPLTYAGDTSYIAKVKKKLSELEIEHRILDSYLDLEIKNLYTIASDIAINMQTTDGFSASIQEFFLTQNVMLLANWLPYSWLKERGIEYCDLSENNLCQRLEQILQNFSEYKKVTINNSNIINEISSWGSISSSWNHVYSQLNENK